MAHFASKERVIKAFVREEPDRVPINYSAKTCGQYKKA